MSKYMHIPSHVVYALHLLKISSSDQKGNSLGINIVKEGETQTNLE
jgi:hypothetical protein